MLQKKKNSLILIVDNNLDDLRHLGGLLKNQGDIIFATSGEVGLFMANKHKPDLVVTDNNLSDVSGTEFCKRLNQKHETQNCNIIVVSTQGCNQSEVEVLEAGAVDYITKPYCAPVVQARIKSHVAHSIEHNLLQTLADKDGLTEVYNRRYFEKQCRQEIKRHYRQQHPITLALLDIDHFKAYNDAYGHLQGDTCLKEVAQALLTSSRRPGEFVARYGGEEFAVVLPNTNLEDGKKYGEWICERVLSLAIPHTRSQPVPFVTISVGVVSVIPTPQTSIENLITTADTALYNAKESGRNQFKAATIKNAAIKEVI